MARRIGAGAAPIARLLCVALFVIGVGSFLFHTFANRWSALADVLPILAFVLIYIFAANRDFWGWSPGVAGAGALAYLPYAALVTPVFAAT